MTVAIVVYKGLIPVVGRILTFILQYMLYLEPYVIIGSVIIADCVQNHPSVWAEKGCWNWVLKDAVLFDKPIMNVKGKLSFWEYSQ